MKPERRRIGTKRDFLGGTVFRMVSRRRTLALFLRKSLLEHSREYKQAQWGQRLRGAVRV